MDERSYRLLQELSEKLGTKSEYLLSVLINHTSIEVLSIVIMECLLLVVFLFVIWFVKKTKWLDVFTPWICVGILGFVILIFTMSEFDNFINACFDKEYWALNKILKLLGK